MGVVKIQRMSRSRKGGSALGEEESGCKNNGRGRGRPICQSFKSCAQRRTGNLVKIGNIGEPRRIDGREIVGNKNAMAQTGGKEGGLDVLQFGAESAEREKSSINERRRDGKPSKFRRRVKQTCRTKSEG